MQVKMTLCSVMRSTFTLAYLCNKNDPGNTSAPPPLTLALYVRYFNPPYHPPMMDTYKSNSARTVILIRVIACINGLADGGVGEGEEGSESSVTVRIGEVSVVLLSRLNAEEAEV